MRTIPAALLLCACAPTTDPDFCDDPDRARSTCLAPTLDAATYAARSSQYFDTMDKRADRDAAPPYSERVVRWEWPPWLWLTAYGRENIDAAYRLLRLYPSIVEDRDCRFFDEQPFGRCRVVFYYDDHEGKPCPIYEEFTFNDAGEITFIEAWSDLPGLLPMDGDADPWAEGEGVDRLSTRMPGLGNAEGLLDPTSDAMTEAAEADPIIADFVVRTEDFFTTWSQTYLAAGDDYWATGCGW